jgi:hypothetical protein
METISSGLNAKTIEFVEKISGNKVSARYLIAIEARKSRPRYDSQMIQPGPNSRDEKNERKRRMRVKLTDLIKEATSSALRFATKKEVDDCVRNVLHEPASPEDYAVVAEGGTMPLIVLVAKNSGNHALSILVKTSHPSFDHQAGEIIIDDGPTPVLNAIVREPPRDGPPLADVVDATNPLDLLRLAGELAADSRPTVRNGTPRAFAEALRLLQEENILHIAKPKNHSYSGDALCAWPLEPETLIFFYENDPAKPLILHATPTFLVPVTGAADAVVRKRRASLMEFIEETEDDECSAHEKIAAHELLRDVVRNFAGDPMLDHPAWKPFLSD